MFNAILAGASLLAGLYGPPALADEGHSHDAAPAPAAAPAIPRFAAASELFEIVGTADGTQLALYLDRFADNAPAAGAALEVSVGSTPVAVKEVAAGEFAGTLAQPLPVGVTSVTVMVEAGNETDLLAGDFDVHAPAHGAHPQRDWRALWPWAAAGLALAATALWLLRRAHARRAGGAA